MLVGMPLYQFVCVDGHEWTSVYSIHEPVPVSFCSVCGGEGRKLFAPPPIIFRGSGFASTDN